MAHSGPRGGSAKGIGASPSFAVCNQPLQKSGFLSKIKPLHSFGSARRYDGPMGKSDRAFVFGLLALLLGLGVPTGRWLFYVQLLLSALLSLTIVNRARRALKTEPSP